MGFLFDKYNLNKMKYKPDYLIIPTILIKDSSIPPSAGYVYGVIYLLSQLKDKKCTASNKTIGEIAGISTSSTKKGISILKEKDYICCEYDDNKHRKSIVPLVKYRKVDRGGGHKSDRGDGKNRTGGDGKNRTHNNTSKNKTSKNNIKKNSKKEKKPYFQGNKMWYDNKKEKWFVITDDDDFLEFAGKEEDINWK